MRTSIQIGLAGIVLVIFTALLLAQNPVDTPITISDGSLNIKSHIPWNSYAGNGESRAHPHSSRIVSSIDVTINGTVQPSLIFKKGDACIVDVTYNGDHIVFSTSSDGRAIQMTPFSKFNVSTDGSTLSHKAQTSKISHVKIIQGNNRPVEWNANGKSLVVIHYQLPPR